MQLIGLDRRRLLRAAGPAKDAGDRENGYKCVGPPASLSFCSPSSWAESRRISRTTGCKAIRGRSRDRDRDDRRRQLRDSLRSADHRRKRKEVSWPADAGPQGAFAHLEDLIKDGRRIALSPFVRDEPIVASKVTAPNAHASLSTIIEPGMRAVDGACRRRAGRGGVHLSGRLRRHRLDAHRATAGPVSEVILQHVKVLAIDQTSNEHQDTPKVAKLVTLEVSQEQALKILLAVNVGKLSLILRQASEVAVAPQARVKESDLFTGEVPPPDPQAAPPPVAPPPESDLRKVTVVRSMRSEQYDVPKDKR